MGLIITLTIIGIILLLAEIMITPGVGITGILGVLALGGSCYYGFSFSFLTGTIVSVINALLILGLIIYVLRAKTWKRFELNTVIDNKEELSDKVRVEVGAAGRTTTRLAPMGTARINDKLYEVTAESGIVDAGTDVSVVRIENNKIYVRPAEVA